MPDTDFQLSDGTWVLPRVPVPDLGVWKEWIGSIRAERLDSANLVLLREEASAKPESFDAVHERLGDDLSRSFYFLHLRSGIESYGASDLSGSCEQDGPRIRQMSQLATFHQSTGYRSASITTEWLEEAISRRAGAAVIENAKPEFKRIMRGLNVLFNGLKETGQDRLHQFVRSLEALILPDVGNTKKQFVHRCQTLAKPSDETRLALQEAIDMRSDTEHLHDWNRAVTTYPSDDQENVCWQRTRQIEHLACFAFARVLQDSALREWFRSEVATSEFWKLPDDEKRALWGTAIDISIEPRYSQCDQWHQRLK